MGLAISPTVEREETFTVSSLLYVGTLPAAVSPRYTRGSTSRDAFPDIPEGAETPLESRSPLRGRAPRQSPSDCSSPRQPLPSPPPHETITKHHVPL